MSFNTKALKKFMRGDSISDKELDGLILSYETLQEALTGLDAEYHLIKAEVYRRLSTLTGFQHARKQRKKKRT